MTDNAVYELREAAERIRDTPRCVTAHVGCECDFSDQLAEWFDRLAGDLDLALDTARKVIAASAPAPKPGFDFLPDPDSSMVTGSAFYPPRSDVFADDLATTAEVDRAIAEIVGEVAA